MMFTRIVPADIYSKNWIPSLDAAMWQLEAPNWWSATQLARFDAIVAATPAIAERFRGYGASVSVVRNSVRLDEFIEPTVARNDAGRPFMSGGLALIVGWSKWSKHARQCSCRWCLRAASALKKRTG